MLIKIDVNIMGVMHIKEKNLIYIPPRGEALNAENTTAGLLGIFFTGNAGKRVSNTD
jgi:hypothetical protein